MPKLTEAQLVAIATAYNDKIMKWAEQNGGSLHIDSMQFSTGMFIMATVLQELSLMPYNVTDIMGAMGWLTDEQVAEANAMKDAEENVQPHLTLVSAPKTKQ